MKRLLAGGLALCAPATGAYARYIEPRQLRVRREILTIADLPRALHGLRIAHVSDTHLGPMISQAFVAHAVDRALSLRPDLVLLTGDYLSDEPRYIEPAADALAPLAGPGPIAAIGVLGNHDWWNGGGPPVSGALASRGVRMIDNDALWLGPDRRLMRARDISPSAARTGLFIVGIGDLIAGDDDVGRAFAHVTPGVPTLLLVHEPDAAEHPALVGPSAPRIDLAFCGHTHGGQVRLPFVGAPIVPSRFGQKYAAGLVQGPRFPVLVSCGVGMTGLPIRFGVPPEIGDITLTGSAAAGPHLDRAS